jgi:hypothetical protein
MGCVDERGAGAEVKGTPRCGAARRVAPLSRPDADHSRNLSLQQNVDSTALLLLLFQRPIEASMRTRVRGGCTWIAAAKGLSCFVCFALGRKASVPHAFALCFAATGIHSRHPEKGGSP